MRRLIFANPDEGGREPDLDIRWEYSDGVVRVYENGQLLCMKAAEPWDGFELIPKRDGTIVISMTPPRNDDAVAMWLVGLNQYQRAKDEDEYEMIIEEARRRYKENEWDEVECIFDNITIMIFVFDEKKWQAVAGYATDSLTKEDILSLAMLMTVYPVQYTEKVLFERLGILPEEFEAAAAIE